MVQKAKDVRSTSPPAMRQHQPGAGARLRPRAPHDATFSGGSTLSIRSRIAS
jgi:hypothetical protein